MKTDFASILSSLRHDSGLSQKKAADDLGISQALLSHYENGVREPKLEFILKACDYYDVSADYILGRTTDKDSSGMMLKFTDAEGKRSADAAALILSMLSDIDDGPLRLAAARYINFSLYVVLSALRTPMKPYDPLFDAAVKVAEACFIDCARKVKDNAGLLPKLTDEALKARYPGLYKAMLEMDELISKTVAGIHESNNANR
jgi:DNA-binding XRE family transcriptional regulator